MDLLRAKKVELRQTDKHLTEFVLLSRKDPKHGPTCVIKRSASNVFINTAEDQFHMFQFLLAQICTSRDGQKVAKC